MRPPDIHARERALVAAAVAGVLERCWVARGELPDLDWPWTLERLRARGLAAYLFAEATCAGMAEAIPDAALAALRFDAEQTAVRQAQLSASLLRAGSALDAGGVGWLPMKGGAFGLVIPHHAAVRTTSDLDLLVRPDQVERAAGILGRSMAVLTRVQDGYGRLLGVEQAEELGVHHLWAFRDPYGILIELHHSVPGVSPGDTEGVWSRAVPVMAQRTRVLVPSLDDLLGTACAHVIAHHRDDARPVLRHLADVRALEAAGASAASAAARYDRGWLRPVATSLEHLRDARAYAERRGGRACAASRSLDEKSSHGGIVGWAVRVDENRRRLFRRLRASGGEAILPSRAKMVQLYGPAAAGPRLPLLHARRWAATLWRIMRGK